MTIPYALNIANHGLLEAAKHNSTIYTGINVMKYEVTQKEVAHSLELDHVEASKLFN